MRSVSTFRRQHGDELLICLYLKIKLERTIIYLGPFEETRKFIKNTLFKMMRLLLK